jgi:hypothetical protein
MFAMYTSCNFSQRVCTVSVRLPLLHLRIALDLSARSTYLRDHLASNIAHALSMYESSGACEVYYNMQPHYESLSCTTSGCSVATGTQAHRRGAISGPSPSPSLPDIFRGYVGNAKPQRWNIQHFLVTPHPLSDSRLTRIFFFAFCD